MRCYVPATPFPSWLIQSSRSSDDFAAQICAFCKSFIQPYDTICSSCGEKENGSIVVFHKSESRSLWMYTGCWDLVGPLSRSKGDWATIYQLQTITCLLHNILQNLYRFSPKSLWPCKRGALLCLWWVVLQVARLASTLNGVCQYRNLDLIR